MQTKRKWRVDDYLNTALNVAKYAGKAYKRFKPAPKGRRQTRGYGGVTQQHDVKMQYRKRRMPRRKRKQWVKFVNKVKAVADKDRGLTTWTFNGQITPQTLVVDGGIQRQVVGAVHIYGNNGTPDVADNLCEIGNNDLSVIYNNDSILGEDIGSDKALFHSAVLDMTVQNNSGGVMEVDVYEIGYLQAVNSSPQLSTQLNTTTNLVCKNPLKGTSTLPWVKNQIDNRGCTPFELGTAVGQMKGKILSKTKYFVGQNQCITKQIRDPKNRILSKESQNYKIGFAYPGYTRSLLIVGKPTYSTTQGETISLRIGATRTYKYSIEGVTDARTMYINAA